MLISCKDLVKITFVNFQSLFSNFSCSLLACLFIFSTIFSSFQTTLSDGKYHGIQYSISIEILWWYEFARVAWMDLILSQTMYFNNPKICKLVLFRIFVKIIGGLFATAKSNLLIICTYLLRDDKENFKASSRRNTSVEDRVMCELAPSPPILRRLYKSSSRCQWVIFRGIILPERIHCNLKRRECIFL